MRLPTTTGLAAIDCRLAARVGGGAAVGERVDREAEAAGVAVVVDAALAAVLVEEPAVAVVGAVAVGFGVGGEPGAVRLGGEQLA